MLLFKPSMYKKNIFEIDYDKLKSLGIRCLIFDLDNTIGLIDNKVCSNEVIKLINELKKDFLVLISSNNTKKRVVPYLRILGVDGYYLSFKPSTLILKKVSKRYNLKKNEMCLIGDQLVTDIMCANRFRIMSILTDPLSEKDMVFTSVNRIIERRIIRRYQKDGILMRGKYYG